MFVEAVSLAFNRQKYSHGFTAHGVATAISKVVNGLG